MNPVRLVLLILFLLFCTGDAWSQYPSFHQLTVDHGLPNNKIYSITRDSSGFVWMGSDAGLYRFDGIAFHEYSCRGQIGKAITGLCVSPNGILYCYNFSGQIFRVDTGMQILNCPQKKIYNISCDANGILWVTGINGLYSFDGSHNKWKAETDYRRAIQNQNDTAARNCLIRNQQEVWFTNAQEVICISENHSQAYPVPFRPADNANLFDYILAVNQKDVWLFSVIQGTVFHKSGTVFVPVNSPFLSRLLRDKKITNIEADAQNKLWICTYSGLIIYDPVTDTGEVWYPEVAFSDVLFTEETVWLSSLYNGLMILPDQSFRLWEISGSNLINNRVTKVLPTAQGIYFSAETGQSGLLNATDKQIHAINLESKSDIQFFYHDLSNDLVYLGTNNSLSCIRNGTCETISGSFPSVKDMVHTGERFYLASSRGTYAYQKLEGGEIIDTLYSDWTRSLFFHPIEKNLWLATNTGIVVIKNPASPGKRTDQKLIEGEPVLSFAYDAEGGRIFALTADAGIYILKNGQVISHLFLPEKDAQCNSIEYDSGVLYCATNKGLFTWNIQNQKWFLADHIFGLVSNDIQSICIQNENLILATGKGIQILPKQFSTGRPASFVVLRSLLIGTRRISIYNSAKLQLDYDEELRVQLEKSGYGDLGNFVFLYRLRTKDENWHEVSSVSGEIYISSLPPGKFDIEIRTRDHFGRLSENSILLQGEVIPPYWQRWWFYLLMVLLAITVSFFAFRYRLNLIRKKQEQELKRITLENNLRFSQQTALAARMNPHFIFNVLNSIKGFIYENDKKQATQYLNSFSDLMRRVLDMSERPDVRLVDEIEIIKLYADLESMLLDGDFSFEISIEHGLDTNAIRIPSLIIQPYIENAFKHGLRHRKGKKELKLKIGSGGDKQILVIEIEDNGIGREAAAAINRSGVRKHDSFASGATGRRINLLNDEKNGLVAVQIEDILNEHGEISGTRVRLNLLTGITHE